MAVPDKTYPEGGRGWVIVLSACLTQFILYGNLKATGVLITNQTLEFETKLYVIGLINALYYGMQSSLCKSVAFAQAVNHPMFNRTESCYGIPFKTT